MKTRQWGLLIVIVMMVYQIGVYYNNWDIEMKMGAIIIGLLIIIFGSGFYFGALIEEVKHAPRKKVNICT
ncbi:hypothetical protein KKC87_04535 [Patescibacteria group bacterium]|nr:hypothetical protein [Patescibacteria group bacterium]